MCSPAGVLDWCEAQCLDWRSRSSGTFADALGDFGLPMGLPLNLPTEGAKTERHNFGSLLHSMENLLETSSSAPMTRDHPGQDSRRIAWDTTFTGTHGASGPAIPVSSEWRTSSCPIKLRLLNNNAVTVNFST